MDDQEGIAEDPAFGDTEVYDPDYLEAIARRLAWQGSPEYRKSRRARITGYVLLVIIAVAISAAYSINTHTSFLKDTFSTHVDWTYLLPLIATVIIVGAITSGYARSQQSTFDDRQILAKRNILEGAESKIAETGNLDLASLWKVTHQRLDYYHDIVTNQARQSFRNAQLAMATGLIVLGISWVGVVLSRTTTGSVVAGALGGLGATLASYIGRTFIRSQESAANHLRSYFDQPLEFSRFLAAERLLDMVDSDGKAAIIGTIVEAITRDPESSSLPPSSR